MKNGCNVLLDGDDDNDAVGVGVSVDARDGDKVRDGVRDRVRVADMLCVAVADAADVADAVSEGRQLKPFVPHANSPLTHVAAQQSPPSK